MTWRSCECGFLDCLIVQTLGRKRLLHLCNMVILTSDVIEKADVYVSGRKFNRCHPISMILSRRRLIRSSITWVSWNCENCEYSYQQGTDMQMTGKR